MDCPNCKQRYSSDSHVPVILAKCGHTICLPCAEKLLLNNSIKCPECNFINLDIQNSTDLPRNLALLSIPVPQILPVQCKKHSKKLEAFCESDFSLLCIDCILSGGHKTHTISYISQSSDKERKILQENYAEICKIEEKAKFLINDIKQYKAILNETANKKREQVTKIYKEILDVVHEKESSLKSIISGMLEKEEESLNFTEENIKKRLESINEYKEIVEKSKHDPELILLENVKTRKDLYEIASKQLPKIICNANIFPEYTRDNELTTILSLLNYTKTSQQIASRKTMNPNKSVVHYANTSQNSNRIQQSNSISKVMSNTKKNSNNSAKQPYQAKISILVKEEKKLIKPELIKAKSLKEQIQESNTNNIPKSEIKKPLETENSLSVSKILAADINLSQYSITKPILSESVSPKAESIQLFSNTLPPSQKPGILFQSYAQKRDQYKTEQKHSSDPSYKTVPTTPKNEKFHFSTPNLKNTCEIKSDTNITHFRQHTAPTFQMAVKPASEEDKEMTPTPKISPNTQNILPDTSISRIDLEGMLAETYEQIFVLGGYNEEPLNTCEKYDPVKGIWKESKKLPMPLYKFAVIAHPLNNNILILGGKLDVFF